MSFKGDSVCKSLSPISGTYSILETDDKYDSMEAGYRLGQGPLAEPLLSGDKQRGH